MSKDLYSRYVWMVETIQRRGRITRAELADRWRTSDLNTEHSELCRRTLYNYRQGIEQLFHIKIEVDPATYEYYIADNTEQDRSVTDWLLNSKAVNDALADARDVSGRIFLEDVPSARGNLGTVIEAVRQNRRIRFDYKNFARSLPTKGVKLEVYFLKFFKQRWYAVGRNIADAKIKTYALDRMADVTHEPETFEMPATFDPAEYFRDAFGIIVTQNEPKRIALRTDPRTAKYLRELPLHHSQQEALHDDFSIFYYKMRITDDLVTELLSYGSRIMVIEPPELRAFITRQMREALQSYDEMFKGQ